jgi:hypothetical protein
MELMSMFGSSKRNNPRGSLPNGIIGPDGRRVDSTAPENRVKLQRTDAEIKTLASSLNGESSDESQSTILPARVVLNEFSLAGVGAYTTQRLKMGQEIALTIDEPRRFYITGRVLICNEVRTESKLIQQNVYPWRVGIEFIYKNDAERAEVSKYCEELTRTWLGALVPSVVPGEGRLQAEQTAQASVATPAAPTATPAETPASETPGEGGSQAA